MVQDDTVKHSDILAGPREVFRYVGQYDGADEEGMYSVDRWRISACQA